MNTDIVLDGGSDLTPGHTLRAGMCLRDYRIDKVLGEGGFGIVYLAYDAALERQVAIKEYLPSSMAARASDGLTVVLRSQDHAESFALGMRSFVNEARLLAGFNHPALVRVLQFWEDHRTAYMVMPYCVGPTLRQVLSGLGRPSSEAEVCAWLMPLLDALEVLHAQNCFHRDIAPDNILITQDGPILLDFGAARRVIGNLTQALTAVLKPGFAPIEQYGNIPGASQGPWTDIYALGSVLYVAIGWVRPVPSVERVLDDRMQPLSRLAAGRVRPGFLAAIDRALAVRPEQRPQSVAEFRQLLTADAPAPAMATAAPRVASAPTVLAKWGIEHTGPTVIGRRAPEDMGPTVIVNSPTIATDLAGTRWVQRSDLPNNLPTQRLSFVGRETELQDIKQLLNESALVTVLGMGGLGKTRLTLQAAAELLPRYPDGAWFVDLTPVNEDDRVVNALARTFDIFDEPGRPMVQTVCAWLKPRRMLIVLDNCEHVVAGAAELVDAILGSAPTVQVLASSRELLDVPGEHCYPILPLPLPPHDAGLDGLLQSAAVRLFADRARAQQPGFSLRAQEPAVLAALVTRLEGIPLAIELAAARLRTLTIAEILTGLADRYQILAGGSRLLHKRQQTLHALVDWSYELLEPEEQQLFARLAEFAGGFDGAAAKAVCGEGAVPPSRVASLLASLVQKSLVARSSAAATSRYSMLDTLRDYAREKLAEHDPQRATAARHCAHYFALAKEAARGMHGAEQGRWTRCLADELENLRAAATCALSGGAEPLIAVKLAVALTGFWILRGHASEGRKLVQAALALPAVQASGLAQAWALYTGAALASSQGDHESATQALETCLALRRELGHPVEIAATLSTLSLARLQAGDAEGAAICETEALSLFAAAEDRRGQAIGWLHLGQIHVWSGNTEVALADLEHALGIARASANREVEAECEITLAEVHLRCERPVLARQAVLHAWQVCKDADDKRGEATAVWWQGRLELELGLAGVADGVSAARPLLSQALREFQAHGMRAQLLGCLDDMALLQGLEGAPGAALALATAAEQARQRLKLRRSPWEDGRLHGHMKELRLRVPQLEPGASAPSGRDWELADAVRAALNEPESARAGAA